MIFIAVAFFVFCVICVALNGHRLKNDLAHLASKAFLSWQQNRRRTDKAVVGHFPGARGWAIIGIIDRQRWRSEPLVRKLFDLSWCHRRDPAFPISTDFESSEGLESNESDEYRQLGESNVDAAIEADRLNCTRQPLHLHGRPR